MRNVRARLRMYLQQLGMRETFHLIGALAQYVRDRLSAFRLVKLLHGSLVEQEDRDLLQTKQLRSLYPSSRVTRVFDYVVSRERIYFSGGLKDPARGLDKLQSARGDPLLRIREKADPEQCRIHGLRTCHSRARRILRPPLSAFRSDFLPTSSKC